MIPWGCPDVIVIDLVVCHGLAVFIWYLTQFLFEDVQEGFEFGVLKPCHSFTF